MLAFLTAALITLNAQEEGRRSPMMEAYQALRYPPLAHQARISGTVIVRVRVDDSGQVVESRSLSGHRLVRGATEENARLWRYGKNSAGGTYVAYFFEIKAMQCREPCHSNFALANPNQAHIRMPCQS